jgi:hypothetical protein
VAQPLSQHLSAFAPKFHPEAIVQYAKTRSADKVLNVGCFPMGLSLNRISSDIQSVEFSDQVWPRLLYETPSVCWALSKLGLE